MDLIGYEDCELVIIERPWHWCVEKKNVSGIPRFLFREPNVRYEMHLPCRDPIAHLLSRCNYVHHKFNCALGFDEKEIRRCDIGMDRFNDSLNASLDLHCFNSSAVQPYFHYMDTRLQRKRAAFTSEYVHRNTNKPRGASCLQEEKHVALRNKVEEWLIATDDYYRFCRDCMGSTQELPLYY